MTISPLDFPFEAFFLTPRFYIDIDFTVFIEYVFKSIFLLFLTGKISALLFLHINLLIPTYGRHCISNSFWI